MENFSLLTISGPRLPSCARKSVRDVPAPRSTPNLPACPSSAVGSCEPLGHNCTIYRPWFSPYSYFVCKAKARPLEACSCPDTPPASARDAGLPEVLPDSTCCSSCSLEKALPREGPRRASPATEGAPDRITARDVLRACRWLPAPQNGYKCAACCRVFPTLHSLKTHVKCGFKEGFSCQVYYQRLKALWEREGLAWPNDRTALGSCPMPK
ncbi:spermatogenesis-associated protein 46 [Carettochelys insculpta]|uniref:spermatogenesis-associated protein 46 n=1 Tax=Carettochelys insculpta TaxID=44489 RepID=UPI003EBC0E55